LPASRPLDRTTKLGHLAETLGFAAAGGLAFGLIGIPAGFLSGAMLAVAAAALAGRPMYLPLRFAQAIYIFIGVSLGGVVTPATLHGIATYPLSIVVLLIAMSAVGFGGASYLRLVHGWDRLSAFLAAAPGGLSQVMVTAAELGAELRGIAIVQSVRVVMLAISLPAGLAAFGLASSARRSLGGQLSIGSLDELAILVVVSTIAAVLAHWARFPGGLLFGSMLASAVLHGSGLIHAVMPWWVANTAMIALGSVTGSRFANTSIDTLLKFLFAAFGTLAVSVVIGALGALTLVALTPLRIADVMTAFAPGAVDAMMLLALALNVDPVYVGAHHLARIFFVSFMTPVVAHRVARHSPLPAPPPKPPPFQD
jgi:membrane AbrB-like protein